MPGIATAPAPQHMQALAQANKVRLARAELKRQVADGELSVADVVLDCPWEAESMTIADLLMSQHRWGRTRCRRFLMSDLDERDEDDRLDDRPPAPLRSPGACAARRPPRSTRSPSAGSPGRAAASRHAHAGAPAA